MAKLFGTDGIRGKVGVYPLTEDMIYKIGTAVGAYVKDKNFHKRKRQRVSIAKDTRGSGDMFEQNLTRGINSMGVDVIRLGILPTPCSAYIVQHANYDMGIVISASHNDIDDNGIKFFTHKGYKLTLHEEDEIEGIIFSKSGVSDGPAQQEGPADTQPVAGNVKDEKEASVLYLQCIKDMLGDADISKYNVVIDCAFGATSHLSPGISSEFGLNIISKNDTPDGSNINKEAGSLFPNVLSEHVISHKCDCGFAFDGDGDRVIACDEKGQVLDGDFILAIIGKYLYDKGRLNKNSIVTTLMSNLGLEMAVSQWGGRLIKTEVGDKYVLDKMIKSKLNLGGEQSGHIILMDHTTTGDGLLVALFLLKIMAEESKSLGQLARCMYKFPQVLVNVDVKYKRPIEDVPRLTKVISKAEGKLGGKGRIYVRYSGTEGKLRIMIEGQNQIQIKEVADDIAAVAREELNKEAT